jgi:hypothetical protein
MDVGLDIPLWPALELLAASNDHALPDGQGVPPTSLEASF